MSFRTRLPSFGLKPGATAEPPAMARISNHETPLGSLTSGSHQLQDFGGTTGHTMSVDGVDTPGRGDYDDHPNSNMKVVILAGGKGSRLLEETRVKSKAMVKIGDYPIIWHIMKYYSSFGLSRFVIALGYQADSIRSYFEAGSAGPVVTDGPRTVVHPASEPGWTIELVDTGVETLSGGRLMRLKPYLGSGPFLMTYCDGLADVDIERLLDFHRSHGRLATLTAVHPPARYGRLALDEGHVSKFGEKAIDPGEWINGGFFVLSPQVLEYVTGDTTQWERGPLTELADDGQLMAYRHESFWQCMDTLPEAILLNDLWRNGEAPWRRWARAISMASIGLVFSGVFHSAVECIAT